MRELSPEQGRALQIVACLTLLHGRAPTFEELGSALGCSRQAAQYRLHYLEKKGFWRSSGSRSARGELTVAGITATRALIDRALAALQGPALSS